MSLLLDDECRVCFHVHPNEHPCTQVAHDPGPDGEDWVSECGCPVYVDLEAQSHIVVSPCRDCPHEPHGHTWVRIFTEDGQHIVRVECSGCHMTPYEVLLKRYVAKREAPV